MKQFQSQHKKVPWRNCNQCGEKYKPRNNTYVSKYCSKECHNKGMLVSVKKKCKNCGKEFVVRPVYIKRYSTCSKKCQRESRSKEKNANWRHGNTNPRKAAMSLTEYKEWRFSVFKRDGFKCVMCGKDSEKDLEADHIKPWAWFPELRYDVNNGRTLCKKCHLSVTREVFKWRKQIET